MAKSRLPTPLFHYIDGGADDESTLRRNTSAFDEYNLIPNGLADVANIDLSTTWPIPCAPPVTMAILPSKSYLFTCFSSQLLLFGPVEWPDQIKRIVIELQSEARRVRQQNIPVLG